MSELSEKMTKMVNAIGRALEHENGHLPPVVRRELEDAIGLKPKEEDWNTPWEIVESPGYDSHWKKIENKHGPNDNHIVDRIHYKEAEIIVKCVNSHKALVGACKQVLEESAACDCPPIELGHEKSCVIGTVEAALRLAGEIGW